MSGLASEPIVVTSNSTAGQLMVALRSLLTAAAAWAVGKGYMDPGVAGSLVSVAIILAPIAWSQIVAKQKHDALKVIAEAAPNNVAVVK